MGGAVCAHWGRDVAIFDCGNFRVRHNANSQFGGHAGSAIGKKPQSRKGNAMPLKIGKARSSGVCGHALRCTRQRRRNARGHVVCALVSRRAMEPRYLISRCFYSCSVWCCFARRPGGVGILEISLAFVCALLAAVSSVHIALSWERSGAAHGQTFACGGPGLYFTIPILEHGTIRVDQRTIATPFYAEKTLTADLVPVTVDAVLFWMVGCRKGLHRSRGLLCGGVVSGANSHA